MDKIINKVIEILNLSENVAHQKAELPTPPPVPPVPGSKVVKAVKKLEVYNPMNYTLQVFENHNYLTYFPHVDTTEAVNRFILNPGKTSPPILQTNLNRWLKILYRSPLIKINEKIVLALLDQIPSPKTNCDNLAMVIKVLMVRNHLGVLLDREKT